MNKLCLSFLLSVLLWCSLCYTLVKCDQQQESGAKDVNLNDHPKTKPEPPHVNLLGLSQFTKIILEAYPAIGQCKISIYLNVLSDLVKLLQNQLFAIKFSISGVPGINTSLELILGLAKDASDCISELCKIGHHEIVKDLFTTGETASGNFTSYISKLSEQFMTKEDEGMIAALLNKVKACTFKLVLLGIELTNFRVRGLALLEGNQMKQLFTKMITAVFFTNWYILDTLTALIGIANRIQGYADSIGQGKIPN